MKKLITIAFFFFLFVFFYLNNAPAFCNDITKNSIAKNDDTVTEESVNQELIEDFMKDGLEAFNNRDYYEALSCFEAVLEIDPSNKEATKYKKLCEQKLNIESSSNETKDEINGNTYINDEYSFSITPPDKWTLKKSGSEIQFLSGGSEYIAINMGIKVISAKSGFDEYITLFKNVFKDFSSSSPQTSIKNNCEAISATYTYNENGSSKKGKILYLFKYRFSFIIFGDTDTGNFTSFENAFDKSADTFNILDLERTSEYKDWNILKTPHFTFYAPKNTFPSANLKKIADLHEEGFAEIQKSTGINFNKVINFYLYSDDELLFKMTRRDAGFAIVENCEVHSIWTSFDDHQSIGHEMAHVIIGNTWGEPSNALTGEGVAVYLDLSGNDLYKDAKRLINEKGMPDINRLSGDGWFSLDSELAYRISGAICRFIAEKYGFLALKTLYQSKDFLKDLEKITNMSPSSFMDYFRKSI